MPLPIVDFTYIANIPLEVSFINTTEGATTYDWDFGDGASSTDFEPTHSYATPGLYTVTLTATNEDGSLVLSKDIAPDPYTTIPLEELITMELPVGMVLDPIFKATAIKKWQLWLQVLVVPKIPTPVVHNDQYWPTLANNLVALCVIYDAYMKQAQGAAIISLAVSSGNLEAQGNGQEKRIVTGPTEVEWFEASKLLDILAKPGATKDKQSIFDTMRQSVCDLAFRINVKLPMCPVILRTTIVPQTTVSSKKGWNPILRYPLN